MGASNRPVVLPWSCNRSGDCCRQVSQILFTKEEAELARGARPDLSLTFHEHLDKRFVYLEGKPCPLLAGRPGEAVCTVWNVRPYNCRRFGCFRPDVVAEPFELERVDLPRLRLGCANLSDRLLASRGVRRAYALMQRKSQRWALAHGWTQDMTPSPTGSNVVFYSASKVKAGL